ncbi:oligosaccharide flippase family protein [Clostridium perfringens]|nr:oligosaccharide flippase family protein [Clostridium perfringens]
MHKKYKSLLKNTAIFTVGSFGSKVLSFLIIPLYTYVLTTSEYGQVDLFSTAISLMIPFSTLLIQEALIRYLSSGEIDSCTAVNNSMLVFIFGSVFTILMCPFYANGLQIKSYVYIYIVIMILNTYTGIFTQYLRADGKVVCFTISGLISTVVLLASNVIFLIILKLGIYGYFYSMLLAQVCVAIYITISGKIISQLNFKKVNMKILIRMLKYSIPLVPNSLMWWIMSAGDKYIINYYMGDSANGIFSIAMKLPMILSMLYNIFMQAWQLSAVEESESSDKTVFYNNVFLAISFIMIIFTSIIIIITEPLFKLVMSVSFSEAWKYVPLMCIATIINCFATFAGTVYIVSKKSIGAFYTTAIGAIINLVTNFMLIKWLGLQGVAIGTILGYLIVMIIRMYDAKKILRMNFDIVRLSASLILLFIESILILNINNVFKYITTLSCLIIIIIFYKKEIFIIIDLFNKKINVK